MQDHTFDRLTKTLAAQPTRRGFLRGLGALAVAGFATTAMGQRRTFKQVMARAAEDPEEQSVLLFEEIGRIADEHTGTCRALSKKIRDFEERHHDQIEQIRVEQSAWTREHRAGHADKYGDRRLVVVDQIQAATAGCGADNSAANPNAMTHGAQTGTPHASPAAIGAFAPAVAALDPSIVHGFAQADSTCDYNFIPYAYCAKYDSDWTSPSFPWPAHCSSGDLDGSCELCEQVPNNPLSKSDVCTHYWPQDCQGGDGEDLCEVKYHQSHGGLAGAVCDKADPSKIFISKGTRCYSNNSDWHSPTFGWELYCPKGYVDHDCIVCSDSGGYTNPDVCTHYWPQDCSRPEGNVCTLGFHVDDTAACCHGKCPVSTSDCMKGGFEVLFDAECAGCMLALCGSTSRCMDNCESNGCCDYACSDNYNSISGIVGAGKTGGTPVPLGTPTTAPASPPAVPTTIPTSAPTTVPTVPPTTVPPTSVPTAVPTIPPTATPAASPVG